MDLRPRLDGMPVEIIDSVVSLLTLSDICSLRLTGREVNAKSSQGVFKSHFYNKTVTMSASEQLQRAVSVTQRRRFGCLLKHLTLVGLPDPRNHIAYSRMLAMGSEEADEVWSSLSLYLVNEMAPDKHSCRVWARWVYAMHRGQCVPHIFSASRA